MEKYIWFMSANGEPPFRNIAYGASMPFYTKCRVHDLKMKNHLYEADNQTWQTLNLDYIM